jgi:hypothetical protein
MVHERFVSAYDNSAYLEFGILHLISIAFDKS